MSSPRLEIHLDRIHHNAAVLVERLATRGIGVTGVTKALLGSPELARELLDAGVGAIGESRIENIEALRRAGVSAPLVLIRSPMLSQVDRVVAHADVSLNTEPAVLVGLSGAAQQQRRTHGVVLMVELGDLREGILPADLEAVASQVLDLPGLVLRGVGANLACHGGIAPDDRNMAELSELTTTVETALGVRFDIVSGGNSANMGWALGHGRIGRVNDLRLGESILLGLDPLDRRPIDGLRTDAVALVAEVIESKVKPSRPWGDVHQGAFGVVDATVDSGDDSRSGEPTEPRAILAVGRQDVDPDGLVAPAGVTIRGSSSDHLIVASDELLAVGAEVSFGIAGYGALLAAGTSPYVDRVFHR